MNKQGASSKPRSRVFCPNFNLGTKNSVPSECEGLLFMTYTVYILKCKDSSLYVGCTNNLQKRIKEHSNSKKGAHYTKIRRPIALVHSEGYATLKEAKKREAEIKKWRREKKLKLITSP